jgi:hypothetical protein
MTEVHLLSLSLSLQVFAKGGEYMQGYIKGNKKYKILKKENIYLWSSG